MPLLSEPEFLATFSEPMRPLAEDDKPLFDFWDYFDQIPPADFAGRDCSAGSVSWAYRDGTGRFEHVLVDSDDRDVFMVIVLDLAAKSVVGHHLLDLPKLYGLREPVPESHG